MIGRELYVDLCELLAKHSIATTNKDTLAEVLTVLNGEDAPPRDQDMVDFLADLYLYVVFGFDGSYSEGFKNDADVRHRLESLRGATP